MQPHHHITSHDVLSRDCQKSCMHNISKIITAVILFSPKYLNPNPESTLYINLYVISPMGCASKVSSSECLDLNSNQSDIPIRVATCQ